ncbi:2-succinyl-5-enolpyruvyl-6-hydroxy-3-cyclohexene-1-carboxylic-acid synthase [Bacillus spongiae]|uniref:2-succinyl-5-enolpyruvyl-6-hydroxy-3-cyclohexene-1-carboxylate synthase n=1 Tax=Bacillus spongiae TaxID=2683610 RepID=A0ABU8HI69_9BACI
MTNHPDTLTAFTAGMVQQLYQSGVENVVISPGSRSTPLALMFAEHPNIDMHINIDERSAAFFALGMAKAANKPVALLCTSGTAAANYYPAIIEAKYSRIPLIVITADRPHELREVGAPQAIDQIQLYGNHVKWFVDLPIPENDDSVIRFVQSSMKRGVMTALESPAGPVHFNVPFREPLIPDLVKAHSYFQSTVQDFEIGTKRLSSHSLEELAHQLDDKEKGLIICGPMENGDHVKAILNLAKKLQFPILADPLSYMRSGLHNEVIECYDSFLKVQDFQQKFKPDCLIRFGAMPVSKTLTQYIQQHEEIPHWIIDPGRGWRDPISRGTHTLYVDESSFCIDIMNFLQKRTSSKWLINWKKANEKVKLVLENENKLLSHTTINEVNLFSTLKTSLPPSSTILVGNSMPIRDMDTFFHQSDHQMTVMANRGANGIDGVVSTALGISALKRDTFLLIGDISFFHDLNGLLAAKMYKLNLTIIVINNNGGGIFSYLPQSKHPTHFEELFGTPTDIDFQSIVEEYGGKFERVRTWADWLTSIDDAQEHRGLAVIEVVTNRQESVDIHRSFFDAVSQEIRNWLETEES